MEIMVFDKLLQRQLLQSDTFSVSLPLCLLLNNTVGIIPVTVIAMVTGEFWEWPYVISHTSTFGWLLVALSGILGCSLGYLALQVQQIVSATTFIVLQNFSKVLSICIGVLVLGDPMSGVSSMGCICSILGSAWYSLLQRQASKKEK